MANQDEAMVPEWDLGEWEKALTIHVGTTYACRACGNLVMVTKGGVGVMDMVCCGQQMEMLRSFNATEDGGGE